MTIKNKINLIPHLISEKKLTEKKAIDFMVTEFFKNPESFIGKKLKEENLSDLVESILADHSMLFKNFKSSKIQFYDFFKSFLYYKILSLKKNNAQSRISEATCELEQDISYENQNEKYFQDEYSYKIAVYEPYTLTVEERAPYTRTGQFNFANLEKFNPQECVKAMSAREKTTLFCALKCCYYLNTDNLRETSKICRLPETFLINIKENLSETFEKKEKRLKNLIEKRDKAYYLHKKYSLELNSTEENTLEHALKLKTYRNQTASWLSKIEEIKRKSNLITPTNRQIAEQLGVKERLISFYISKAEDFLKEDA